MNELEALQIYQNNISTTTSTATTTNHNETATTTMNDSTMTDLMVSFFTKYNASTIYVITQGVNGAIAFRHGHIVAQVHRTVDIKSIIQSLSSSNNQVDHKDIVIDPTGAGDAFCAGFFHSLWQSIQYNNDDESNTNKSATSEHNYDNNCNNYHPTEYYWSSDTWIQDALLLGCTMGTCAVSQRGASIPPTNPKLIQIVYDQYILLNPKTITKTDQNGEHKN
jgi:sugar/nucleoside kinase (ribokinase family)